MIYECINCGKHITSKNEYQYGYICTSCRKTTKLKLICSICGKDIYVTWDTFRYKDPNIPFRCRKCNDDYRNQLFELKPDEEKQAFIESQRQRSKAYYENRTEEEIKKDHNRRVELWNKRKETGEAKRLLDLMKEGRARWYDSLSSDEKFQYWQLLENGRAEWWNNLDEDERFNHMKYPHEGFRKWFDSMTDVEKDEFFSSLRKANEDFWINIKSDNKLYREWKIKVAKGYKKYLLTITPNNSYCQPNKNEADLIKIFEKNNLKYIFQYPNITIHDDFDKLFPHNPITGADLVDPIHMWDFLVRTRTEDIFVDIDGSMHFNDTYNKIHPYTKIKYKELDYKKFKDSMRKYQTDGLRAYVILCKDDKLKYSTEVTCLNSDRKMSFKDFLTELIYSDLTDNEKSKIII